MKQRVVLIIFVLSLVGLGANDLFLRADAYVQQQDKRSQRAARRAQRDTLNLEQTRGMIESRNFTFYANDLIYASSIIAPYQQLNNNYYVEVTPTQLTVQLPVYGGNPRTGRPSIARELDFFTGNYSYSAEPKSNNKGWSIEIKAVDTWSMNSFTFEFDVTINGYGQLDLSTPFVGPAQFSGTISQN